MSTKAGELQCADMSALDNEERLVWLEDVDGLDYVRESRVVPTRPTREADGADDGLLVRYAELRPDAPVSAACVGPNGRRRS